MSMTNKPVPPVPGQPHPDVELIETELERLAPGEMVPYDPFEALLGYSVRRGVGYARMCTARRRLLSKGINIVVVRGEGLMRQTDAQTVATEAGSRALRRLARRRGRRLATVDPAKLDEAQRAQFFAERTINNVVYVASGRETQQRVLAAAKVSQSQLPMAKALEVLSNGK
jgi:hypothetical protein